MPNITAHSATRPLAAPAALPTARAAAAQPQLGLGRQLASASNRCAAAPDRPQTTQGPVPQQARFQSLLFRVANGEVNASPARQDQAVALYGLSHAQMQLSRFVRGELDMQNVATIANYNKQLNIVHYSRDDAMYSISPRKLIQEFSRHISDAAAGKLVKRAPQPAAPSSRPGPITWAPITRGWTRLSGSTRCWPTCRRRSAPPWPPALC
ncbi:hypothetical protein [Chromobacterium sp. Beijing]|uniref:hypothetical protein n=1 Tax=Chromobacterium sp. Beijing TaxID=2735795 RepID=UPI001F44C0E4|nr:hypothetical protein [Chromobacterium sp. Beijing]UJB30179.1 hypothetical protein HQN78_03385 [Chromobacterium sp. Beijing]